MWNGELKGGKHPGSQLPRYFKRNGKPPASLSYPQYRYPDNTDINGNIEFVE